MPDQHRLEGFVAGGRVAAEVFVLRPDYRALLIAVDGIAPGPREPASEQLLMSAEAAARAALAISR